MALPASIGFANVVESTPQHARLLVLTDGAAANTVVYTNAMLREVFDDCPNLLQLVSFSGLSATQSRALLTAETNAGFPLPNGTTPTFVAKPTITWREVPAGAPCNVGILPTVDGGGNPTLTVSINGAGVGSFYIDYEAEYTGSR